LRGNPWGSQNDTATSHLRSAHHSPLLAERLGSESSELVRR
jgi:hypothetical protein